MDKTLYMCIRVKEALNSHPQISGKGGEAVLQGVFGIQNISRNTHMVTP